MLGSPFILSLLAAAGQMGPVARASVIIRVSVAPRHWIGADGSLCSNLSPSTFDVQDRVGRTRRPATADAKCGLGAASQLNLRAEPGELLIISAE